MVGVVLLPRECYHATWDQTEEFPLCDVEGMWAPSSWKPGEGVRPMTLLPIIFCFYFRLRGGFTTFTGSGCKISRY